MEAYVYDLKVGDKWVRVKIGDDVEVLLFEVSVEDDGSKTVRKFCLQNDGKWLKIDRSEMMTPIDDVYRMDELTM